MSADRSRPETLIDHERYPVTQIGSPVAREVIAEGRRSLAAQGAAILPAFVTRETLAGICEEVTTLIPQAHREDIAAGTPYLELPDEAYPLGALNAAVMFAGDTQGWHYDSTDFVVSLALQSSEGGGNFECAPFIRSEDDERYDAVARVLQGDPEGVEVFPMTPGTLMIFAGRCSLHRVSAVEGERPRYVALLAYDTKPGTEASDLLKLVRYGRKHPKSPS